MLYIQIHQPSFQFWEVKNFFDEFKNIFEVASFEYTV